MLVAGNFLFSGLVVQSWQSTWASEREIREKLHLSLHLSSPGPESS